MPQSQLPDSLRRLRYNTTKDLAAKLGINHKAYQAYEQGVNEPPMSVLISIADHYDITLDELIYNTH